METLPSGIIKYEVGSRTIWDMRNARRGRYIKESLKEDDVIIVSDRKVYKVDRTLGWRNIDKTILKAIIDEMDFTILQYKKSLNSNTQLKENAG